MWTALPPEFEASSGFVLEAPCTNRNTSRIVVGCSVAAKWSNGTVNTYSGSGNAALLHGVDTTEGTMSVYEKTSDVRIHLDNSWLETFAPTVPVQVPGYNSWGPTTIESLLTRSSIFKDLSVAEYSQVDRWNKMGVGGAKRTDYLEWILSMALTDGISRYNSASVFNSSDHQATGLYWNMIEPLISNTKY